LTDKDQQLVGFGVRLGLDDLGDAELEQESSIVTSGFVFQGLLFQL